MPQSQTTDPCHHEEEAQNTNSQPKQNNKLSLPQRDDCKIRKDTKYYKDQTQNPYIQKFEYRLCPIYSFKMATEMAHFPVHVHFLISEQIFPYCHA